MSPNALLAQSLRRWKEDCAPVELKRYARREWGAETCFLHQHSGSKRPSSVRSVTVALFHMVRSLLGITRSRLVNENKLSASRASEDQPVQSPEIPSFSITTEDVSTGLADPLIIGLGHENHRTTVESASATIFHKSKTDQRH